MEWFVIATWSRWNQAALRPLIYPLTTSKTADDFQDVFNLLEWLNHRILTGRQSTKQGYRMPSSTGYLDGRLGV